MHIVKKDLKQGVVKVRIENADDLWVLQSIIQPDDLLSGSTERKLKLGNAKDEKKAVVRKRVRLTVKVEKHEYAADGSTLRALGVIVAGPDEVPRGEHHSFILEPGVEIGIQKAAWPHYVLKKLENATKADAAMLVLLFDREEAKFYSVTRRGVEELLRLKGSVNKKAVDEKKANTFYKEIVKELEERYGRGTFQNIIAAAPAFWREYLEKELPTELKKKVVMTTISAVEKTAIRELLGRPEVQKVLQQNSTLRELSLVEEVMAALGKDHLVYGTKEVGEAVGQGNVQSVITTESHIAATREDGSFRKLEELLRSAESSKGEVHVLSADEAMTKIDALGGVVAIKRW